MTFRNRALLDLAHDAPCFLQLGTPGCGKDPSVPAHSDMIRHGRAVGHKSHDCFAVPSCPPCHAAFTRANLGKEGYFQAWVEAMERFILWKWVSGKIRLADITQRAKETAMEAPLCRICSHRHWAREPHILPADAKGEVRSKRVVPTNGADTNCRTLRTQARMPEGMPGSGGRGMNGQREVSRQGIVRPTNTSADRGKAPKGGERTPGKTAGKKGQRRAAKPTPGKRKPRTKKG